MKKFMKEFKAFAIKGNMLDMAIGVIIGAAIMGVLDNGLVLLNVSAYWQQAVLGLVIVAAVAFGKLSSYRRQNK